MNSHLWHSVSVVSQRLSSTVSPPSRPKLSFSHNTKIVYSLGIVDSFYCKLFFTPRLFRRFLYSHELSSYMPTALVRSMMEIYDPTFQFCRVLESLLSSFLFFRFPSLELLSSLLLCRALQAFAYIIINYESLLLIFRSSDARIEMVNYLDDEFCSRFA